VDKLVAGTGIAPVSRGSFTPPVTMWNGLSHPPPRIGGGSHYSLWTFRAHKPLCARLGCWLPNFFFF